MSDITQDSLKDLLHYDKESGVFTWKVNRGRASIGSVAGTVCLGYTVIRIKGKGYKAHRLAWLYINGKWPVGDIDHINQTRTDNYLSNLREVSQTVNSKNASLSSNNTSGFNGVCWAKLNNKWKVHIETRGKKIYLGYYSDIVDAIKVRQQANILYGFHENHGAVKC